MIRRRSFVLCCALLCVGATAFAADVQLDPFSLLTRGEVTDGTLALETVGDIGIRVESGYRTTAAARFGVTTSSPAVNSADADSQPSAVEFRGAELGVRRFLGTPLRVRYFTGSLDRLGSGKIFAERFGTYPIEPLYQGLWYSATGQTVFEGVHGIHGTGVAVDSGDLWDTVESYVYLYQDDRIDASTYSADFRTALVAGAFHLEFFGGATFPAAVAGRYRAGIFASLASEQGDALTTQMGITHLEPGTDEPLDPENFYFLFEPRVGFDPVFVTLTLFWHPGVYDHQPTETAGLIDVNSRIEIGDPKTAPTTAGIEGRVRIPSENDTEFAVSVGPFAQTRIDGVEIQARPLVNVLPLSWPDMFEFQLGVQAHL